MSRIKSKSKTKAGHDRRKDDAPQPEQLAAVRRLLEHGHVAQARQQCAALRRSHPGFKPLYGLACEIEEVAGDPLLIAARAWEWHHAAPHSVLALELLAASADAADLNAVAEWATRQLQALDGDEPDTPPPEPLRTPLGPLSFEQGMALDLGRMHMGDDHFEAAIEVLRDVDHPSARNNHALALFHCGDVRGAQAMAEAAWRASHDNLFALERSLRWRCWLEGMAPCRGFAATLRASRPRRSEDAIARVSALRFLGDEEGARAAWEDSADLDFWDDASAEQEDLFEALRDPAEEFPGEATLWLPRSWSRTLEQLAVQMKTGAGPGAQQHWDTHLDHLEAHTDYLVRACALADHLTRFITLEALKRRAEQGNADARQALPGLLVSLGGADTDRTRLLQWLDEHGLHDPAAPVPMRAGDEVREVRSVGLKITTEPRPTTLSKEGLALAERMNAAGRRGDLAEARKLGRQLLELHPDHPMALSNLAGILQASGEPHDEVMRLFREALARDPDYLFARCGLAHGLVQEGRLEEARQLLDGLVERGELHISEFRALSVAQRTVAQAAGDHATVRAVDQVLRDLERQLG